MPTVLLLISLFCLIVGLAGLVAWVIRVRELRALSEIRARQMVAQAQAELSRG
jgi:hypothetical protein